MARGNGGTALSSRDPSSRNSRVLQDPGAGKPLSSRGRSSRLASWTTPGARFAPPPTGAPVAVVDTGLVAGEDQELCESVRSYWPDIPIVALVYCTRAVLGWHVEAILRGELAGLVDLRVPVGDMLVVLASAAHGHLVVEIGTDREHMESLRCAILQTNTGGSAHQSPPLKAEDKGLLSLAARGLSEDDMSRVLYLSPHTVHHRIERLRHMLGLRNRIELAAWAGQHGLYQPASNADPELTRGDDGCPAPGLSAGA